MTNQPDSKPRVSSGFTISGKPVSDDKVCPNIFAFCAFMGAAVAAHRGGNASDYLSECAHFMADVVGKALRDARNSRRSD